MKKILALLLLCATSALAQGQAPRVASGLREYTYTTLPTSGLYSGLMVVITDALNTSCGAGSGSVRCILRYTGSAWEVMAAVGGVGTGSGSITVGDGSAASYTITGNVTGTDTVMTLGDGIWNLSTGSAIQVAGVPLLPVTCTPADGSVPVYDGVTDNRWECGLPSVTSRVDSDGTVALLSTDRAKAVYSGHATANAVSIAQAGTAGFEAGYYTYFCTTGAGLSTITPTTSTINGATTLVLQKDNCAVVISDGTNYRAIISRQTQSAHVWLPAAGCNNATAATFWDLPTSAAATAACVTGTNIQKGVLQYADSGPFNAQITLALPVTWRSDVLPDFNLYWTTTATSGNAKWTVQMVCTDVAATATDDPAFPVASNGFNTVTTAAPGTGSRVQTSSVVGATFDSSCVTATKELLHINVKRDGTDGSDTIGATANFIGLEFVFRRKVI